MSIGWNIVRRGGVACVALSLSLVVGNALAQQRPSTLPSQLIEQLRGQDKSSEIPEALQPGGETGPAAGEEAGRTRKPAEPGAAPALPPPSALERDFSTRAGRPLRQFGYETFRPTMETAGQQVGTLRQMAETAAQQLSGAVGEDYRIGVGDEIILTFRGQVSQTYRARVDRDGRLVIPNMPPIPAAGRRLGELKRHIEALTDQTFLNTQVFVSVGSLRMLSVLVTGEVSRPGSYRLSGLSTVVDALNAVGGVAPTGSLRRVQISRGGRALGIDLYDLLLTGHIDRDLTLVDGDIIHVPVIGPTIAIGGEVLRPGIYELDRDRQSIADAEALSLAGGPIRPRGNYFLVISADEAGRDTYREVDALEQAPPLGKGSILLVLRGRDTKVGAVHLNGNVTVPGPRSLATSPTVGALVGSTDVFRADPYLPFAVLETTDERTRARYMVGVNLEDALSGRHDVGLRPDDRLIVLGKAEIRYLGSADVQAALKNRLPPILTPRVFARDAAPAGARDRTPAFETPPAQTLVQSRLAPLARSETDRKTEGFCRGLQALAAIVTKEGSRRFDNAKLAPGDVKSLPDIVPCPELYDIYPDLLPFVVEHAVAVGGEIREPGLYPVTPGTPMVDVLNVAGGFTRNADRASLELSRAVGDAGTGTGEATRQLLRADALTIERITLRAGDTLRVNPRSEQWYEEPVTIRGQVHRPGSYRISRGERLSELIARAGGLTDQAYPLGAVFTRESVREREKAEFERAARDLELRLTDVMSSAREVGQAPPSAQALQAVISALRATEPVGRVVIEADPAVLQVRPESDTVLEPGDALFVPQRPNLVAVFGEVLNAGSLPFRSGANVDSYIQMAGGLQESADERRIFVVLPNGVAQTARVSFWNYTPVQIPPGSTIVVPKDLTPFRFGTFATDMTQILSNVAITAASLAVIGRNR